MAYSSLAVTTEPVVKTVCAVVAVLLLLAFIIGFVKGFRRVSWSGIVWLTAGTAFFLLTKNGERSTKATLAIAGACILVTLVLYGVCALTFRPREKWVKRRGDRFTSDEYGIDYDEEVFDYDDYEEYEPRRLRIIKGMGTPGFFGRLFGGIVCALNTAMVLFVVFGSALLLVTSVNSISGEKITAILSDPLVSKMSGYVSAYALDMLAIGIVVFTACKGYEKGLIDSLRALLVNVGRLAGLVGSFYLPFSKYAASGLVGTYVNRFIGMATKIGLGETTAPIAGKIFAGLVLCVVVMILLQIVNKLLQKLVDTVEEVSVLRIADGALSCLIYLVIGVALCAVVFAALYALGYYGIFDPLDLFTQKSALSTSIYELVERYGKPILEKIKIGK